VGRVIGFFALGVGKGSGGERRHGSFEGSDAIEHLWKELAPEAIKSLGKTGWFGIGMLRRIHDFFSCNSIRVTGFWISISLDCG
jgi:hypothetical protein